MRTQEAARTPNPANFEYVLSFDEFRMLNNLAYYYENMEGLKGTDIGIFAREIIDYCNLHDI